LPYLDSPAFNGAFVYGVAYESHALAEALTNLLSVAFIVEALILVGLLPYLFQRWGVSRLSWGWFVILSLMVFAISIVRLFPKKDDATY
jgi:hypothetical protein